MKKYWAVLLIGSISVLGAWAEPAATQPAPEQQTVARPLAFAVKPDKEQRKIFKQRNKQIRRLVKQYQKASAEQKPLIKEQLAQIVSEATDDSMAWATERVAAEKENLILWEQKLKEQQNHLDEIKAKRVEELLSGEAKHRYKLAKKRWKKEIKALKKSMR